jgi:hypothetical protein
VALLKRVARLNQATDAARLARAERVHLGWARHHNAGAGDDHRKRRGATHWAFDQDSGHKRRKDASRDRKEPARLQRSRSRLVEIRLCEDCGVAPGLMCLWGR